jgi:hypothetical protein
MTKQNHSYRLFLKRQEVIDTVALLIQLECLSKAWFKEHEPSSSTAAGLGRVILESAIKQGLVITDV